MSWPRVDLSPVLHFWPWHSDFLLFVLAGEQDDEDSEDDGSEKLGTAALLGPDINDEEDAAEDFVPDNDDEGSDEDIDESEEEEGESGDDDDGEDDDGDDDEDDDGNPAKRQKLET